jgi:Fungal domain of unknown function (DUF1746)
MNTAREDATEPAASPRPLARSLSAKTTWIDHLDALLHSLDVTIFLLLGVVYCSDNLTFLLLLRASCQTLYTRSTQFSPTVVANIICIVTHIVHARPEGTKHTRGYLHGGLILDFVGELAPISKFKLLLLDAAVLALQLCYLAISHELQVAKTAEAGDITAPPQDIEAEEAGIRREEQDTVPANLANDGIELQSMFTTPSGSHKTVPGDPPDEDIILTLDLRRSLFAVIKKNTAASLSGSDTNVGRLGTLIERISAARAAAERA